MIPSKHNRSEIFGLPTANPQRVTVISNREQCFDRFPDGIYHFGIQCAHDDGVLHLVVVG